MLKNLKYSYVSIAEDYKLYKMFNGLEIIKLCKGTVNLV